MPERNLFTRADRLKVQPIPMLIARMLPENSLAGLIGASGTCKSFLAIAWACHVATGTPWFGRAVKPGVAFVLAGEGQAGIAKRIRAWEEWSGVSIIGAPLYVSSGLTCLCDHGNIADVVTDATKIAEAVFFETGLEPALFVIDTLARGMAGRNENSSEDMSAFVGAMDWLRNEWKATVLVVHHAGLDPSAQERGRGSSAFRAALDVEMVIRPIGGADLVLKTTKAKDWAPMPDLTLVMHEVKMLFPIPPEEQVPHGPTQRRETSLVLIDRPGMKVQEDLKNRVLDLRANGHSIREIHKLTGLSVPTVGRWVKGIPAGSEASRLAGYLHTPARETPSVPRDGTPRDTDETARHPEVDA